MQWLNGLIHRQRHYKELQVGAAILSMFGARGTPNLPCTYRQWSTGAKQPFQPHFRQTDRVAHMIIQGIATIR